VQPDWGLPRSVVQSAVNVSRRKIAISPPDNGWIVLVESNEVVDFALAQTISEEHRTVVLAVQVYEVSGASGFATADCGQLTESRFSDWEDDPMAFIRSILHRFNVPFDLILFREAVGKKSEGWRVLGMES
jgi:hypothetical protein